MNDDENYLKAGCWNSVVNNSRRQQRIIIFKRVLQCLFWRYYNTYDTEVS